ncbi:3'-5' exonuclease [Rhizobium leguminosarum]|nr:3'-5' exonuclease [Rhizobium leguminosarum]
MRTENCSYLAIDTEGSGGHQPELLELGAFAFDSAGQERAEYHWYFRPVAKISYHAWRVHGLSAEKLRAEPLFADLASDVLAVVSDRRIVAHNAPVDVGILKRHLPGWGPLETIDTLSLARKTLPGLSSYGLRSVASALKIPDIDAGDTHNARDDARLCMKVFLALQEIAPAQMSFL